MRTIYAFFLYLCCMMTVHAQDFTPVLEVEETDITASPPLPTHKKDLRTQNDYDPGLENTCGYLILTPWSLIEPCHRFAQWKLTKGFNTIVQPLSLTSPYEDVKSASILSMIEYYNDEGYNIKYLLLVGNEDSLPGKRMVHVLDDPDNDTIYSFLSDYYYECLGNPEGNSPSLYCGRIPVSTVEEADAVFDKIIEYEQCPPTDSSFYSTGVCCAVFDGRNTAFLENGYMWESDNKRGIHSSENIRTYLSSSINCPLNMKRIYLNTCSYATPSHWLWNNKALDSGGQLPQELWNPNLWNGCAQDITDSINSGTLFLTYLGHGTSTTWENRQLFYHPETVLYSSSFCDDLVNEGRYPVVFSLSCNTGRYEYEDDCPAEFFLKKAQAGAVAVIAPSFKALGGYSEYLAEGLINGMWSYPGINSIHNTGYSVFELGKLLTHAKEWMGFMPVYNRYTHQVEHTYAEDSVYYQYTLESYHLFGDPSMQMYTASPLSFNDVNFRVSNNTIHVNTHLSDTRVSFSYPHAEFAYTFNGSDVIYHDNASADSIVICVDKHNYIPHVVTYYKNIFVQNELIDDSRNYVGQTIQIGRHVTDSKPQGDVLIQNADIRFYGGKVTLGPGVVIEHSNVLINPRE